MKKVLITLFILMNFGITKGQSIYNNSGQQICVVQGGAFYSGGNKIGFVQNRTVYNGSGKNLGSIVSNYGQGASLYNNNGQIICTIQEDAFYSGGRKVGFVQEEKIYNSSGNQIGFARGLNILEIAIYLFYLSS